MRTEANCPVCYAFIEMEDGVGYCILCEEIIYTEKDGTLNSDALEWLNKKQKTKNKKQKTKNKKQKTKRS